MSGETGQLQRLTDEQVSARLEAYNPDGSLERDIALLWEHAGDIIAAEVRGQFGAGSRRAQPRHFTGKVDCRLGPARRRIRPPHLSPTRPRVPVLHRRAATS